MRFPSRGEGEAEGKGGRGNRWELPKPPPKQTSLLPNGARRESGRKGGRIGPTSAIPFQRQRPLEITLLLLYLHLASALPLSPFFFHFPRFFSAFKIFFSYKQSWIHDHPSVHAFPPPSPASIIILQIPASVFPYFTFNISRARRKDNFLFFKERGFPTQESLFSYPHPAPQ